MSINVLHVVSELSPFATTGGLADVSAALPRALAKLRHLRVAVVAPRYRSIDPERHALARRLDPIPVRLGDTTEQVTLFEGKLPGGGVPVYLLDHPLFHRGGLYGENGEDYPDNARRFALLARGAVELMHHLGQWPDVVHAHDWQAGLAPFFFKLSPPPGRTPPRVVHTIHNLAFQGNAPASVAAEIGIPEGEVSLLKIGLAHADRITTVSPRYAREIQTPDLGCGLDAFLKERSGKLTGILNGIDTEAWNPERDQYLAVRYDAHDRSGKAACKAALQRELALPARAQVPLYASISRLTEQKGFALLAQAADEIARLEIQMVLHGNGERRFEDLIASLARRYPTKVAFRPGYDEALAHRIQAGADFYVMPSRFEPCGLAQLYALRYGTLPIVRATGGLDDTVVDYDERTHTGTGFKFAEYTGTAFAGAVKRSLALYHHKIDLDALVGHAMAIDHSWTMSARRYAELYEGMLK